MEIKTAFGASVDVITGDELRGFAKGLAGELRAALREERNQSLTRPVRGQAYDSALPSGLPVTLSLGSPSVGRYWSINQIAVGDVSYQPVTGTQAFLAVGTANSPTRMDFVDVLGPIPCSENYSPRTLIVSPSQDVYVYIVGATSNELWAAMRYADYPDTAVAAGAV